MQKAWYYEEHGPKEVLKLGYFPIPTPKHDQLLVQVKAAALNPIDFKIRQRSLTVPVHFPFVPGCDMSGVVDAKGEGVSRFNIGDEVYGNIQDFNTKLGQLESLGTLAQFIVVEENLVTFKPKNISFEEAASLPVAAETAVEGFKMGSFRKGMDVFVVGGGGGVGTLVVQLAKQVFGASKVAATSSTSKMDFLKSLGVDKVYDYTRTRYEEIEEKYDMVYDTIGDSKNSYVVAKENVPVIDITWPPSNTRAIHSSLTVSGEILEILRPCLESGKLKPVVDPKGPFCFDDVVKAFGYLETGRARGKVVISSFPWCSSSSFCETKSQQHY
ncbi:hypothetical protein CTI12_AA401390 [Artemisia annua]|uniref:Enoyl reductase (ER) domain-containing protein n=1 Tax=Artemisia annua TaxID=35608 RepID=A0A2U1MA25_ARTAN|nr:hypothetical protein CTI12_AA401390 [Artemisia annua]